MSKWGNDVLKIAKTNPDIVIQEYRNPKVAMPAEVKEIFKYSKHEWRFKCLWESIPGPALEFNYRFDKSRRWRVDWVHLSSLVAIEIEGKGHQFDSRYYGDIFKYNALAEAGYTLIRLTSDMITVQELERIIERIKEKTTCQK